MGTGWLKEGREWGACRYDGAQLLRLTTADGLVNNRVRAVVEDRAGRLWFGTFGGISCYDGTTFENYTTADGLLHNYVWSLLEDKDGWLWIGSWGGLNRWDGQRFETYSAENGLIVSHYAADGQALIGVSSILEDRQGQLWIGTWSGLSRWDGQRFETYTTDDGLANNWVRCLAEDHQGGIWAGTWGGGLSRWDGCRFRTYTPDDGLANNWVFSALEDRDGYLWLGTQGGGLSRFDQAYVALFTTADGLPSNGVTALFADRTGQLWAGTWEGLARFDNTRFVPVAAMAGKIVQAIAAGRQRGLWLGTNGDGVLSCNGQEACSLTSTDGLAHSDVRHVLEDRQGHLWFATDGGVSRYDGKEWVHLTPADGLAHKDVRHVLEDRQGQLWFATDGGGVSCYDGMAFTTFTVTEGLCHDEVNALMEDRQGQLWFATNGGLCRFDGRIFQHLSRNDGLAHDAVHQIIEDRSGAFWIATEDGLTRYRPQQTPPGIRLTEVIADRHYGPVKTFHMSTSQQLLIFEFQGRSLTTPPERMVYVYQLVGYEEDWQAAYSSRVEYQDLPLGDYTFRVKAVDRDLNYSDPAEVRVSVEPDALVESLTATLGQSAPQGEFVGHSPALQTVKEQLRQVAPADLTVLILGETGTGKGLAARTLHELSSRQNKPFVQVTCGGMPEPLIESELFGHEKGAFTGAVARRLGKVELAQGGSLFLDEIGDMSLAAQVKLLRLLEERTFERVGGTQVHTAQVRVVAATNRDLRQMVQAGTFREDLYYRLHGFEVRLPSLRQRKEDIPLLALYFIGPKAAHLHKEVTGLSRATEEALVAYDWPGNVRELMHVIESAVVVCAEATIQVDDLLLGSRTLPSASRTERVTLEEHERRYIQAVLEDTGGVVSGPRGAATVLGLNEGTLRARMRKLGIRRS